ncbi:hypothetical protein AAFF_G00289140 [Aldrovandia affinis]|uniref:Uncharacterized protein n=1 Tax=Aldrovandia affinis TaxID=143900 RepID=A0AAD7W265_9TELE|nr:hypothetical protein AAFF_G00289140 [Aldrovandia affinis]
MSGDQHQITRSQLLLLLTAVGVEVVEETVPTDTLTPLGRCHTQPCLTQLGSYL